MNSPTGQLRKKLSTIKGNIFRKQQIPVGFTNKALNFIFKKIFRYENEKNYDFNFLNEHFTNRYAISPIQKDEAIFLYGLLKVIRPKVCVEFGFNFGHSSYLILNAIEKNGKLYSFDILNDAEIIANTYFKKYKNFKFIKKSQAEFSGDLCENSSVDFVFFDASHDLEINIETFERIKNHLSDIAYIVIHDTGLWNKELLQKKHRSLLPHIHHKELSGGIAHQIDERKFVNWIVESNPEFNVLHFHTLNCIRHGITIISNQNKILKV